MNRPTAWLVIFLKNFFSTPVRGDGPQLAVQFRSSNSDSAWEFLHFSTCFEMLCALIETESNALCERSFGALLVSLLAVLRSHRDYQKRSALVGLRRLVSLCCTDVERARWRLLPALHGHAPLLLDALRITVAFREEVLAAQLFALFVALLAHLDARQPQIASAWEAVHSRIDGDAAQLVHASGMAEALRKRWVLRYYLAQLKAEKMRNVRRWSRVFDVILQFLVGSDDAETVELCFGWLSDAVRYGWCTLWRSSHAKVLVSVAKLLIKVESFRSREYAKCRLCEQRTSIWRWSEGLLLALFAICESDAQRDGLREKLVGVKSMPILASVDVFDRVLRRIEAQKWVPLN